MNVKLIDPMFVIIYLSSDMSENIDYSTDMKFSMEANFFR